MFITYALSIGCAVALLGLFLEWAGQRNWPKRRKMWGSLILTIGALGVAPITAQLAGPLPVAAACSCMTLALSLRGYQAAPAITQAHQDIFGEQTIAVLAPVEQEIVEEIVVGPEAVVEEEIVAEEVAVIEEEIAVAAAVEMEPAVLSDEMAAWLNVQISSGYVAKANGLWEQAATAFDAAVSVCADRELKGMLEEELQECLAHFPDVMKAS